MGLNPEFLKFLESRYIPLGENEYGADFVSEDKTHKVHLGFASVSFCHPTNVEFQYVFGTGVNDLRRVKSFLEGKPSFDEENFLRAKETKKKK